MERRPVVHADIPEGHKAESDGDQEVGYPDIIDHTQEKTYYRRHGF